MKKSIKIAVSAGIVSAMALMAGSASAADKTFGLIVNNMAFPYNVVLADGFTKGAAAKGAKVLILDSKMSMETQANQVDDLLAQKVDGIAFMPNEALIAPPHPPIAKSSIDRMTLDTSGSPHGNRRIQPNNPVPPRARPASSSDAMMVNAVTKLG